MAGPKEVVVDASVVSKWFLPERDSSAALALRDEHVEGKVRLLAPDLLPYEVVNVVRHAPGIGADQVFGVTRDLFDFQLGLVRPTAELLSRAVASAFEHRLTVYDACYLGLAEVADCQLVTQDSRLLAASPRAVSLSHWRPRL